MMEFRTNEQLHAAIFYYYNPETNVMASVQYRKHLELYEVRKSYFNAIQLTSLERVTELLSAGNWEFIGAINA